MPILALAAIPLLHNGEFRMGQAWTFILKSVSTSLIIVDSVGNKHRRIKGDATTITVMMVANIPTYSQPFCI